MYALGMVDRFMAYNDGNTPSHASSAHNMYNAFSAVSYPFGFFRRFHAELKNILINLRLIRGIVNDDRLMKVITN